MKPLNFDTLECEFKIDNNTMRETVAKAADDVRFNTIFGTPVHLNLMDEPMPIIDKEAEVVIVSGNKVYETIHVDMYIVFSKYVDLVIPPEWEKFEESKEYVEECVGLDIEKMLTHLPPTQVEEMRKLIMDEDEICKFVFEYNESKEMYKLIKLERSKI